MVKSVLGVANRGLRGWIVQRVSAVIIAVYSLGLIGYLIFNPELYYAEWRNLFAQLGMKIATLLTLVALASHAWVGMWTILTDYVKPFILRGILELFVLLTLAACLMWGLMILWSV